LAGTIDASAMQRMNAAVDQEGRTPRDTATTFLAESGDGV
jgi:glycine betaine/choline ABC-type transport system substrate-binding protein